MQESEKWKWSRSVVSNSQRPHGLQPTRLLRPWDFPGKSTGVGCHCLIQSYRGTNPQQLYLCPSFIVMTSPLLFLLQWLFSFFFSLFFFSIWTNWDMPALSLCFHPWKPLPAWFAVTYSIFYWFHILLLVPMVEECARSDQTRKPCNPGLSPGCSVSAHWLLGACPKVSEQHSHFKNLL